jgi:phosphatidylinositol 4-kinase
MYKSHGDMMNCFDKGEKAIEELVARLNPEGSKENFCFELINKSLDNWRAKWYDKIQYCLQKIYY